jgi:DNA replication protein DnaC
MLSRLRDGFDDETYAKTRDEFSRVHLLAIDDLGANKQVTDWPEDHSDDIVHHG